MAGNAAESTQAKDSSEPEKQKPEKLSPYFKLCFLLQLFFMITFQMTVPLIAQYAVDLGMDLASAGFLSGIFSIFALIFRPFSGFIANRMSKKAFLLFGFACCALAFFAYAFCTSFVSLMVVRALHALGLCTQTTIISVLAAEFLPKERMAEGIGYIGLAAQIGLAIGPTIGVALQGVFGYFVTFVASGILMIVIAFVAVPIPSSKQPAKPKGSKIGLSDFFCVDILPLAFVALTFAFCQGLSSSIIVLMGNDRGIEGVTLFFLLSSIFIAIIRPAMGKRVDRKGLNSVIFTCFGSEALCMAFLAMASNIWFVLIAAVGRIFGQGVAQSSLQGQTFRAVGPENRGTASSTFYMGIDIGQGCGAMVGGALAGSVGFTASYLSGIVLLVLGFVVYLLKGYKRFKR